MLYMVCIIFIVMSTNYYVGNMGISLYFLVVVCVLMYVYVYYNHCNFKIIIKEE